MRRKVKKGNKKKKGKKRETPKEDTQKRRAHLTKRMDRQRVRAGRAGIKYYSRISVLTPLLRGVSPTCHLRRETTWEMTFER